MSVCACAGDDETLFIIHVLPSASRGEKCVREEIFVSRFSQAIKMR